MKNTGHGNKTSRFGGWFQCIFTLLAVFILVCTTLLLPIFEPGALSFLIALLPALLLVALFMWLSHIFHKDFSASSFRWMMTLLLALAALGIVFLHLFYEQTYFSDALVIREQVESLACDGTWLPEIRHYFQMYPNNMGITTLFLFIRRLFGSWKAVEIVGSLLCLAGVWLTALTVRRITEKRWLGLLAFVVCLFMASGSVHAINPYSHNFGFPFVALAFYIYTSRISARWKCLWLSLAAAAGCYVKSTILIPFIAIAVVEFVSALRSRAYRSLAFGILCPTLSLTAMFCVQRAVWERIGYQRDCSVATTLPYFLATGMNSETAGRFSFPLMWTSEFMEDLPASRRDEVFLRLAERSICERRFLGNLRFFAHKTASTWGDATLDNFRVDYNHPVASNLAWPFVLSHQTLHYALLLLLLFVPSLRNDRRLAALALAFLGVFLYQLFFEAHPRYLFMFFPILVTLPLAAWTRNKPTEYTLRFR